MDRTNSLSSNPTAAGLTILALLGGAAYVLFDFVADFSFRSLLVVLTLGALGVLVSWAFARSSE